MKKKIGENKFLGLKSQQLRTRLDPDSHNMFFLKLLLPFSDQRLPHPTARPRKDNASVRVFTLSLIVVPKETFSSLSCQILLCYITYILRFKIRI